MSGSRIPSTAAAGPRRGGRRAFWDRALLAACLVALVVVGWCLRSREIELFYATHGFSPIHYTNLLMRPENFVADCDQGIRSYRLSSVVQVYPLLARWVGVAPERVMPVFLLAEYVAEAVAVAALVYALIPGASALAVGSAAAWLVASNALEVSLSLFAMPRFLGLYYVFANALRLGAIAMALRGRVVAGWLLVAASFTCHAAMGMLGGVFLAAMALADPRRGSRLPFSGWSLKSLISSSQVRGAGLAGVVMAGWFLAMQPGTAAEQVPRADWFALSRMFNKHFFPFEMAVTVARWDRYLLPFLAFGALFFGCLRRGIQDSGRERKVVAGQLALLALTALGLLLSLQTVSIRAVQLCLHRATQLFAIVGVVPIVAVLAAEALRGTWWRRPLAAGLLAAPFLAERPFPLLLVAAFLAPEAARAVRAEKRGVADWAFLGFLAAALLVAAGQQAAGLRGSGSSSAYVGKARVWEVVAGFALATALARAAARRWPRAPALLTPVLGVLVGYHAVAGLYAQQFSAGQRSRCGAFLDAQLWARRHTPPSSLFMSDPSSPNGWRDFSRRCSFGSAMEWLSLGFLYTLDGGNYRRGKERLAALGLDLQKYLREPIFDKESHFLDDVRARYYGMDGAARRALAQRFGIDYFVLRKEHLLSAPDRPAVYENEYFLIVPP